MGLFLAWYAGYFSMHGIAPHGNALVLPPPPPCRRWGALHCLQIEDR